MTKDVTTGADEAETKEVETETVEETETEDTTEVETEEVETTVAPKVKLTYAEKLAAAKTPEEKFAIADAEAAKNRRLLAKKDTSKAAKPGTGSSSKAPSQSAIEETVLIGQGFPEELLPQLRKVAAVSEVSLLKAQSDPLFVAIKDKFEKDKKQKDASLGASRGAGGGTAPKTFNSPGLSRDEHKAMVLGSRK